MTKSDCYKCKHRGSVPGDAHSCCLYRNFGATRPTPSFSAHGIKMGWVLFPWNFDPVWMTSECVGFEDKK